MNIQKSNSARLLILSIIAGIMLISTSIFIFSKNFSEKDRFSIKNIINPVFILSNGQQLALFTQDDDDETSEIKEYTIEKAAKEALRLAFGQKFAIYDYYSEHGAWPKDNISVGTVEPDRLTGIYVRSVQIYKKDNESVFIKSTLNNRIKEAEGKSIILKGYRENGKYLWTCKNTGSTIKQQYLPEECKK